MSKFILVTAMVLASATAQAGASRGLTVASNDEPAVVEQPKSSDVKSSEVKSSEVPKSVEAPKPVEAPKYVEKPAAVDTKAEPPKTDTVKPVAEKDAQLLKAEKPKRWHESAEARVIYELHRHGIYW
jgi:hypothetical protein